MPLIAILADLHGNLPALDAVLADLAQFHVDQVVVAGDIINWGPFSAGVLARVAEAGWAAIRGNNEYYLLDYESPRAPASWSDRSQWPLLPWLKRQLGEHGRDLVATWPDSLRLDFAGAPPIRVVHGSARSNTEPIYPGCAPAEAAAMLEGVAEPVVIAAHTHLPMALSFDHKQIFNPGSVGVPLDGRYRAHYLLLEGDRDGWRPTFRQVPIDPAPVLREFERQGFAEECGVIGRLVMAEFQKARLELHPFLAWRQACWADAPLTPALLEEFAAVDRRRYIPAGYRDLPGEQAPQLSALSP